MTILDGTVPKPKFEDMNWTLAARADWRFKLIYATKGNQSLLGCIVLASIKKQPSNPPYFIGTAKISNNGDVLCDFFEKDGMFRKLARVGSDEDLARNILGLAIHCGLTESERVEFLAGVNAWITVDERDPNRIRKKLVT